MNIHVYIYILYSIHYIIQYISVYIYIDNIIYIYIEEDTLDIHPKQKPIRSTN